MPNKSQSTQKMGETSRKSDERADDAPAAEISRRSFLKGAGVGAAGVAALQVPLAGAQAAGEEGAPPLVGPGPTSVTLHVNGRERTVTVEPRVSLAEALRDHLGLTGTKVVCERGACGGCTVLLDGAPVVSCMLLAVAVQGKAIRTVEGLAPDADRLDPLQEAFIAHDALQCGYCTPGMLMSCRALLDRNAKPSLSEVKAALSGNVCRCGSYPHVFDAVLAASGQAVDRGGERG